MISKTRHRRRIAGVVLALLALYLLPAAADTRAPWPDWLVPVVRMVSDTHVVPTTGIHVGQGRVLVPAEFVVDDEPLLVLDGGADLGRYGRPARLQRRFNLAGLALLAVDGLQRSAPRLATAAPVDGDVIELLAYPPVEDITAGRSTVRVLGGILKTSGIAQLSPRRPLPNLTGALVDACGHWLGHSAARGVPSMSTVAATQVRWMADLEPTLALAGIDLPRADCDRRLAFPDVAGSNEPEGPVEAPLLPGETDSSPGAPPDPPPGAAPASTPEPPSDPGLEPEPESEPEPEPEAEFEPEKESDAETPDRSAPESAPVAAPGAGHPAAGAHGGTGIPAWWLALGVVLLVAGLVLAWWLRRRSMAAAGGQVVFRLVGDAGEIPLVTSAGNLDLVLGRYDADVLLAGPSVSRHHARLEGTVDAPVLIDLDSTNGSRVNDRACVPGEPTRIAVGDRLRFGAEEFLFAAGREVTP